MTDSPTNTADRRGSVVAVFGLVAQLAATVCLFGVALASSSQAVAALFRFSLVGLPIWVVLILVFRQQRRVQVEALETAELKRARESGGAAAIFELDDEGLLLEQNRLRWLTKWFLPAVTVIVSLALLIGQFVGWGWDLDTAFAKDGLLRTQEPTLWVWFVVGAGFLCFLFARYTLALAKLPHWELLHGGATILAGISVGCLGLAVAMAMSSAINWTEPLFAYVCRVAMVLLGIELAVNFALDFYRPRTPGEFQRPSFDSRLLGLFTEPGGIAKSIADTINYQFGFEVSKTWFYRLLQRWMLPLIAMTLLTVLLLTSVVIVSADEKVVIERLGREPTAVLGPGIHFKRPFPFDIVYRAPARRISEVVIGEATEIEEDSDHEKAILWTEEHDFVPELMLLVASPELVELSAGSASAGGTSARSSKSVAASLLLVSVPIQYRIKDTDQATRNFLYKYDDPEKLLVGIAYQHLSDYAAGVDVDSLMGSGRARFNKELRAGIQRRADEMELGIEIVFVGLLGAHPPAKDEVAKSFQSVVSAKLQKEATIATARGLRDRILTDVAGSVERAETLDDAIRIAEGFATADEVDADALREARARVEDLLIGNAKLGIAPSTGHAAEEIANAKAEQSRLVSEEQAKVRAFVADVAAYGAAPDLYRNRKILDLYKGLDLVRKIVIVGDPSKVIIEIDMEEIGGLDTVLREAAGG